MMATVEADKQIFEVNPYEGHASLTQLEAEVLWEYAKLSQHVKIVQTLFILLFRKVCALINVITTTAFG